MKNFVSSAVLTALLIIGSAGLSLAGYGHHGCNDMKMGSLTEMDANGDGVVSLDEFTKTHIEKYEGWFKMLDADDDGSLSQEELDNFLKHHGKGEGV